MRKRLPKDPVVRKQRFSLSLLFSLVIFCILLAAVLLAAVTVSLLVYFNVIGTAETVYSVWHITFFMVAASAVIGYGIAILAVKIPLTPVNHWINNMNRLAEGDYKVRMQFGKALSNHPVFEELSGSFNKLAEELGNTEMLRSDFINNFSHEFKTPIVSIAGLAKVLKKGNLTEEQKMQYLDAIEEESMRLAYMATNVLNLTKVENQAILSDVTTFNLSEQIRSCVLLLENKWSKKNLELQLDMDEYEIEGNEELLKQVWINLLDNAVKFASARGTVSVEISAADEQLSVSVSNTGSYIPPEDCKRIWTKFYQRDTSHATEGNGVGLAIVKRITDLHKGTVSVASSGGKTTFTVELPKKQ